MEQTPFKWAGWIRATSAALEALAGARQLAGLEALRVVAEENDVVWVRGPRLQAAGEKMLGAIPWDVFYDIIENGGLRREGRFLPEGKLPEGTWQALGTLLYPSLSTPALPGKPVVKAAIELRPHHTFREANLLQADLKDWLDFGNRASEIRLKRLIWALDSSSPASVLIRGTPLPPLPGMRFFEEKGIVVPAGLEWWPRISAGSIRSALRVAATEMVILQMADGPSARDAGEGHACVWRRIPRSAWLPATRSTIRSDATHFTTAPGLT